MDQMHHDQFSSVYDVWFQFPKETTVCVLCALCVQTPPPEPSHLEPSESGCLPIGKNDGA